MSLVVGFTRGCFEATCASVLAACGAVVVRDVIGIKVMGSDAPDRIVTHPVTTSAGIMAANSVLILRNDGSPFPLPGYNLGVTVSSIFWASMAACNDKIGQRSRYRMRRVRPGLIIGSSVAVICSFAHPVIGICAGVSTATGIISQG